MREFPPLLLKVVLVAVLLGAGAAAAAGDPIAVDARRLLLDPEQPSRSRVGALSWRGGLVLTSEDPRFGGFSALLLEPDGRRLTALSDKGHWLTARLLLDSQGAPTGLRDARLVRYRGLDGKPLEGKHLQDAESVARLPDGSLLVGFEGRHRIWRYPAEAGPGQALMRAAERFVAPPDLERAPFNGGLEAMVALPRGRVLAFAEDLAAADDPEGLAAFLWTGAGWARLSYRTEDGFKPTAAARLPDGDLLVLERRFTLLGGLTVRLMRLDGTGIGPGAALFGEELARLSPPLAVDNMEGMALGLGSDGETLLYLISDDNFNPLQRTLLLVFALEP